MDNSKISVIVPVYKVEQYLRDCVDSITNQTYQNLEILLVDDGSPDSCPAICDEFAANDSRVKVIHKKNGGLSSARNAGLENATGEFIAFVDSDDWIDPQMYEKLLSALDSTQADIAVGTGRKVYEDHVLDCYIGASETMLPASVLMEDSFRRIQKAHNRLGIPHICCNLYRQSCINGIRFYENNTVGEDIYFWLQVCSVVKNCAILDVPQYNLRFNDSSIYGSKSLAYRAGFDYTTIKACLGIAEQHEEMLPFAVEHLIAVTFIYFDAMAKKRDLHQFMDARKYLYNYRKIIADNRKNYTVKYRLGLFLLRYFPHVLYLMTVYRMTRGKWKDVK